MSNEHEVMYVDGVFYIVPSTQLSPFWYTSFKDHYFSQLMRAKRVVLDLRALSNADDMTLAMLMMLRRDLEPRGCVVLLNVSTSVYLDLIEQGIAGYFDVEGIQQNWDLTSCQLNSIAT
jgi:ABC-type transporter Mla MlaB component